MRRWIALLPGLLSLAVAGCMDPRDPLEGTGTGCGGCHGADGNPAPPPGLTSRGSPTLTTDRGVGAHAQHLDVSTWHATVRCEACHLVPKTAEAAGHADTALPAEVTFAGLAVADSAAPKWNGVSCKGTYCHGSTLSGGSATLPVWTRVDGTQKTCTSCHGMPPSTSPHTSASTSCHLCHGAVVDSARRIIQPSLHIDGKVGAGSGAHPTGYREGSVHGADFMKDPKRCTSCHGANLTGGTAKSCESCHPGWRTSCVFCHGGTQNKSGAPPVSVGGKTATSVPGVGRHTAHVTAGSTHVAYACALCHKVPTDALSVGHIDASPAEVTFTGLAKSSAYDSKTYWCTNVYCHGTGKGSLGGSAQWTGSIASGCSTCHDDETDGEPMTLSGRHAKHIVDKKLSCVDCHNCVVNSTKAIVSVSKHIDGTKDVCLSSWNPTTRTCSPSCHNTKVW